MGGYMCDKPGQYHLYFDLVIWSQQAENQLCREGLAGLGRAEGEHEPFGQTQPTAPWAALGRALQIEECDPFPILSIGKAHLEYCVQFCAHQYKKTHGSAEVTPVGGQERD